MSEAPPFWFQRAGPIAWLLSPLASLYGNISARRMLAKSKLSAKIPVFCIGNLVAGGAGKTPTALAVAKIAIEMGMKPGFLSRGYGGSLQSTTIVDREKHNAHDVGDEPLLLNALAPTIVSADRVAGALLLEEQDVDLIIMDDGFQNPTLHKDMSLVVVDTRRGIGNGYCIPAGPVRAKLSVQMAAASAFLLIGETNSSARLVRMAAKMAKPILSANTKVDRPDIWPGLKVLAFAGIADPKKFYLSLESAGAEIVEQRSFHDHHPFSDDDCEELLARAKSEGLTLVTTEKDAARLIGMGENQEELLAASQVLKIELNFENPKMVEMLLTRTIDRAREYRLNLRR